MSYEVRPLGIADADDYRRVRLDALRLHPEAFGADYAEEAALDRAHIVERLSAQGFTRFGGFADDELVGLAGLQIRRGAKEKHKARLFSMYVDEAHRGTGLAQQLVEAAIAGSRQAGVILLHLTVNSANLRAQRFYRRMGFTVYGVERRSLQVGGQFHDEDLMVLELK